MKIAAIYYRGNDCEYAKKSVNLIKNRNPDVNILLFLEQKLNIENCTNVILKTDSNHDNFNKLEDVQYKKFFFVGCDIYDLPNPVIIDIFSKNIEKISFLDSACNFVKYKKYNSNKSDSISVFPGAIYPINMGSHQRAFNMLLHLNSTGSYTDVLITAGNENHKKIAKALLEIICPNVYVYKNTKKKLPRKMRLRRYIENKVRLHLFGKKSAPDLFIERLKNKATYSAKSTLKRLVDTNNYKNVIINYAWMERVREHFDVNKVKQVNWICDTHDVQYVRGKSNNKGEFRLLPNFSQEMSEEIKTLNSFDNVLAISVSDKAELDKVLDKKSILVTSSFDYAYKKIKQKNIREPLFFGFIGGRMNANVKALSYIIEEWWPQVLRASPSSKLYIAGSVSYEDRIEELTFLEDSIVRMGFVESINEFYNKIDISLNPVLVQGGLNFKSVEALAEGKILITNSMGVQCLGDNKLAYICNSGEDVAKQIVRIDKDRKFFESEKRRMQKLVMDYFSYSGAYSELNALLKSNDKIEATA